MKKIFFITIAILLSFSCTHRPGNGSAKEPTPIVIVEIQYARNLYETCWYRAQTKNTGPVDGQKIWFNDSIGKYDVGDILNR